MGIIVESGGHIVWEPSQTVGRLFVANIRVLETVFGMASGVSPVQSDEVEIDGETFGGFVQHVADKFQHTNNRDLLSLVSGTLEIAFRLNFKVSDRWPSVPETLLPILESAKHQCF